MSRILRVAVFGDLSAAVFDQRQQGLFPPVVRLGGEHDAPAGLGQVVRVDVPDGAEGVLRWRP